MTRRKTLSDNGVTALKPRAKRYAYPDPELRGHYIRVQTSGAKSYVAVARDPSGKQVWATVGDASLIKIDEAREKARKLVRAISAGEDRSGPQSYRKVSDEWFKRHVEKKDRKLRSGLNIRRYLDKHILPAWGGRDFATIKRTDVATLLDKVEDNSGPVAADLTLSIIRSISNWYATRDDNYVSPVVRGMRRSNPKERARDRILSDDEIRAVWKAAEANGTFGAFVRLALLTGQRKDKIASMEWAHLDGAVWHIPSTEREKGNAGDLKLPAAATEIIEQRSRFASNPYVLVGRGGGHFNGFSVSKEAFDAKVRIPHWTIHDLRRTSRSLMSRAGVRPHIAERVMGHAIAGVEGVYDRHEYRDEKGDALLVLANTIRDIVSPPPKNARKLREAS